MIFLHLLFLFLAAMLGSTISTIAGGGSLLTVSSLIFLGVAPISANATSAIALWPGSIASTIAYRREIALVNKRLLFLLVSISLIGSILGAYLLLATPQITFVYMLPYLILFATGLFAISDFITMRARQHVIDKLPLMRTKLAGITLAQLIVAVYCSYFGSGGGIMIVALLAFIGLESLHIVNGLKLLLNTCISSIAVIIFIKAGIIAWPQAIVMVIGAIIGGYGGAYYARKIDQKWIRLCIIFTGILLAFCFFLYGKG